MIQIVLALQVQVVVFLGVECPLAGIYAPKLNELHDRYPLVSFQAVSANVSDTPEAVQRFASEFLAFPMVKDASLARKLGATRSPEVFVLFAGQIVYQGRIDDQFTPGYNRSRPRNDYLADALEAVLAARPVATPKTEAVGCYIQWPEEPSADVSFEPVWRLIKRECVECHRPGQVAPFSLTTHAEIAAWRETIVEVIDQGRMPPWNAEHHFANARFLTDDEKETIREWVAAGAPGEDIETLEFPEDGWAIKPDVVLSMPEPFTLPATGLLDYQNYAIDPGVDGDLWIKAVEIRPGNRRVVHHATLFARPKGSRSVGDMLVAMYVPGQEPLVAGDGLAKRLPAGWEFLLQVHYTTTGRVESDQTRIGIVTCDPATEFTTRLVTDTDFVIPPYNPNYTLQYDWVVATDCYLASVFPHMHLRGKSFRADIHYPDGKVERLLTVDKYDFGWQHRYELAEHKFLPAGTRVRCTFVFDNSAANPWNPDPSAEVRYGEQTEDEMIQAYFDVYTPARPSKWWPTIIACVVVALVFARRLV